MPMLNGKVRARITAIFFKAISRKLIRVMALAFAFLHQRTGWCQKQTWGLCDSHHNSEFFRGRREICL
jgi:hypothetical protein